VGCGQGDVNSPGNYDGFSIVEGHEFGETVTDPFPDTGWIDYNDSTGGENGDKCAWTNDGNVTFSTGTFAMQPLWSNSSNACVKATGGANYSLSVTRSGTGVGTVTSAPSGINCGSVCSANYSSGTSVSVTASPAAGSTFMGWSGSCSGAAATCTVTMTAARTVGATFELTGGTSRVEETAVSLGGWAWSKDTTGNFRVSSVPASTSQFSFSGTSLRWLTKQGPGYGKASVTIDGVSKGTFDLYGSALRSYTVSFTGLSSSAHKLVIKVLGTKRAAATDYKVAVDAFTVGTATTQENSNTVLYDTWKGVTAATASGGSYRVASAAGRTASLRFTGTGVDWITYTGPGWGQAEVLIDGVS
jgi:hypothetical protein